MPSHLPLVRQIDHIAIRTAHPERLFAVFTRILGLPVAFPLATYPTLTSGSVALGNLFLELVRFGPPRPADQAGEYDLDDARPFILSFASNEPSLARLEHLLDVRHVAHSGAPPFYGELEAGKPPARTWANVFLGGLLGDTPWARSLFLASHLPSGRGAARRAPSGRGGERLRRLIDRSFPAGMVFFTEYYQRNDEAKRAADAALLRATGGGPLGVEGVCEVRVGVPNLEDARRHWSRLFEPIEPAVPTCWPLGEGPSLRLVAAARPGIQTLVLRVRSLERARAFLSSRDLLGAEHDGELTLALPGTRGLDLRLAEAMERRATAAPRETAPAGVSAGM